MDFSCCKGEVQDTRPFFRIGEGNSWEVWVRQRLLGYRDGGWQVEAGEGLLHTHMSFRPRTPHIMPCSLAAHRVSQVTDCCMVGVAFRLEHTGKVKLCAHVASISTQSVTLAWSSCVHATWPVHTLTSRAQEQVTKAVIRSSSD